MPKIPSSRIPSPARSQGVISTPRRNKSRRTRSVSSAAKSENSVKLSEVISTSIVLSPLPKRRSVLCDDTFIELPRRQSWWKKLGENSKDLMELLESGTLPGCNNVNELVDVEILSQEKKNYTMDLPESSDNESISSIVIPQRKLFNQKENAPPKNYEQIINNRETLAKLHKTNIDDEELNIQPKNLFSQRTLKKPVFPAALLNMSANKTIANKTKDAPTVEGAGQVRTLFGNQQGTKRKNMFANFVLSESEDEIPEIQAKIFGFKKNEKVRRLSATSRKTQHSPNSSFTDIDIDDWKHLPSSTMMGNQLEERVASPSTRGRLSKLPETKRAESVINSSKNKPNKEKSKIEEDLEEKESSNVLVQSFNKTLKESTITKNKSLNLSTKINENEKEDSENIFETNRFVPREKSLEIQQALSLSNVTQSNNLDMSNIVEQNEEEDFTLEYENDEENNLATNIGEKDDRIEELQNNILQKSNVTQLKTGGSSFNSKIDISLNKSLTKQNTKHIINIDKNTILSEEMFVENEKNKRNDSCLSKISKKSIDEVDNESSFNSITKKKKLSRDQSLRKVESLENSIETNKNHFTTVSVVNDNKRESIENIVENEIVQEMKYGDQDDKVVKVLNENVEVLNENVEVEHYTKEAKESNKSNEDLGQFDKTAEESNRHKDVEETNKSEDEQNITKTNDSAEDEQEEQVAEESSEGEDEEEIDSSDNEQDIASLEEPSDSKDDEGSRETNKSEEVINLKSKSKQNTVDSERANDSDEIEKDEENNDDLDDAVESNEYEEDMNIDEDTEKSNKDVETSNESEKKDQDMNNVESSESEEADEDAAENYESEEEVDSDANYTEDIKDDQEAVQKTNVEHSKEKYDSHIEEQYDNEIKDSNEGQHTKSLSNLDNNKSVNNQSLKVNNGIKNKKDEAIVRSPEAILHDKTNQVESFRVGQTTTVRKTKSMLNNPETRPSLDPIRESMRFSDGTKDSTAEGSGWDSHRTTRKTLRQTFGKDFTLRKSLRTLVMEKSAKRQTDYNQEFLNNSPPANSTEFPEYESVQEVENMAVDETPEVEESSHEVSLRTRQTTLEMYLQKIKKQNIERKLKMEEQVRNSLQTQFRDPTNLFKVPLKPVRRTVKNVQNKPKVTTPKTTLMLPSEFIEDMKYKPPKRFQPNNASWITKRLYKFLEMKLELKYEYKARIRAEKLVQTIYQFTKEARRHEVVSTAAVDELKREMARLQVVQTHFEFYEFFHEFMPREIRVKVNPDIVNKISLPRHGVFSDILQ